MKFAHIIGMGEFFVWSTFLGALFFLAPIFISFDGYADLKQNKYFFCIGAYRLFRIFGGYMQLKKEGLVIHLSKKKAIIVPYDQMKDTQKKFEITKGFQLYRLHQIIETGNVETPACVLLAAALQIVGGQVFSVMQTNHPFVSLKNTVLLSNENTLKVTAQAVTLFNGLVLSMAIGKKILEVIIQWIKEKKLTASWKKRQSN